MKFNIVSREGSASAGRAAWNYLPSSSNIICNKNTCFSLFSPRNPLYKYTAREYPGLYNPQFSRSTIDNRRSFRGIFPSVFYRRHFAAPQRSPYLTCPLKKRSLQRSTKQQLILIDRISLGITQLSYRQMSLPWDYIAKLVCIGDSGTGKSSVSYHCALRRTVYIRILGMLTYSCDSYLYDSAKDDSRQPTT